MEPLPATAAALELLAESGDEDLGRKVAWIAEVVTEVVPQAHAVAIWFADQDLTLVLVDTQVDLTGRVVRPVMRSSLALEMATPTRLVSIVTIYSEHGDVFAGGVPAVERAVGAVWGASAVDDDLAFDARRRAELAPAQLRTRMVIDTAVGLLVGTRGFSIDEAEDWIDHVARTDRRTALEVATRILDGRSSPREAGVRWARELVEPDVGRHAAWLESHREWGPGLHEDGFGIGPGDEVESAAGFATWVDRLHSLPGRLWWMVEQDVVLGGIVLRPFTDDDVLRTGHIGYGVRPSARGRGLAAWALGLVLGHAREAGLERVLLVCADDNVASIRTIERLGGVPDATVDDGHVLVRRYWIGL